MVAMFSPSPDPVIGAVTGLALAFADRLTVSTDPLFVRARHHDPRRTVALVSGGGSGHEPMHVGFVGRGMLDAAVPGRVFASPHNRQVYAASRAVAGPGGVLHIVKNYTGDRINFGIAAERLAAEGIRVARVLVDDDVATSGTDAATGRRGTGATVLVEKILGAAADTGLELDALAALGEAVVSRSRSLAVASGALTLPATSAPAFHLADGQIEYGIGIHGERARNTFDRGDDRILLQRMLTDLLASFPTPPSETALLVNGLGATTGLELGAIYAFCTRALADVGVRVVIGLAGTFVAALDMHGFSLTLTALEPAWYDFLLAPSLTPAFPQLSAAGAADAPQPIPAPRHFAAGAPDPTAAALLALARRAHPVLTDLDRAAGDGDFGDNLVGGLERAAAASPRSSLAALADVFLDEVGGTSGPLIGLLFQAISSGTAGGPLTDAAICGGITAGSEMIQRVGGARPGDRTLLDALAPAAGTASSVEAARLAIEGAKATAGLIGRAGRASYLGTRAVGRPDPGAVGIAIMLVGLAVLVHPDREQELIPMISDWVLPA